MNKVLKRLIIFIIIVGLLVIVLGGGLYALNKPADPNDNSYRIVTVKQGYATADIASALKDKGLISNEKSYKIMSKVFSYDGKYQAGTYSFQPSMRPREIADKIVKGKVNSISFTIPEGYTIKQISNTLEKNKICKAKEFLDACNTTKFDKKYGFLKDAQSGENHLEGFLSPNTYQVGEDSTPDQIIETMLAQTDRIWGKKYIKKAKDMGYTINDITIIASIIEREAAIEDDMAKISSVIYNRIKKNMPLQVDATVEYALGVHKDVLSISDTQIDSPYNTYKVNGLPKGPISAPGKAAIKAALYPESTDYLYYVLSGKLDGSHVFTSNDADFEKAKKEYVDAVSKK